MTSRLVTLAVAVATALSATGAIAQSYNAPAGIPAVVAPGGLEGASARGNVVAAQDRGTVAPRGDDRALATGSIGRRDAGRYAR